MALMWRFQKPVADPGEGPAPLPLFVDQTETRRTKKNFFWDCPHPYLRVWMAAFPLPPYLKVLIRHWKLLSYTFFGGNVVRGLVHFFSVPLTFTLHWWPLAFLILSPPLPNFTRCSSNKKMSPFFSSLAVDLCRLSIVELRWPAVYFLYFSVSLLLYFPNLWAWELI